MLIVGPESLGAYKGTSLFYCKLARVHLHEMNALFTAHAVFFNAIESVDGFVKLF